MCALVTGVQTCAVPISKGGSAWPQSACSGIIESGQIRITPKGRSFQVVVTGAIVHSGNRHPAWCTQDSIDISFTASERPFASLRSEEHTSELQSLMRISYAVFSLQQKILS